jgi:NAD(P)H dehydrogenase (quinone)
MFVITGITGKVGAIVAETLLATGLPVRAVVRSEDKGEDWRARGCAVAVVAEAGDADALTEAFDGADGIFLMSPPDYDPAPGFDDVRRRADATLQAISRSRPGRVVLLSTIGAQATEFNLLNWAAIYEGMLRTANVPRAFLRAAWFMENAAWDVDAARHGRFDSYLQPLDRAIEMVSVSDIGRTAADLLQETWAGTRVVELSGPRRYSPTDEAAALASALGEPVDAVVVPRDGWDARFRAGGMHHPEARIRMLDGFNEGWIDFERGAAEQRRGAVTLEAVVRDLVARA